MSVYVTSCPLLYYRAFTEAAGSGVLSREVRNPCFYTHKWPQLTILFTAVFTALCTNIFCRGISKMKSVLFKGWHIKGFFIWDTSKRSCGLLRKDMSLFLCSNCLLLLASYLDVILNKKISISRHIFREIHYTFSLFWISNIVTCHVLWSLVKTSLNKM